MIRGNSSWLAKWWIIWKAKYETWNHNLHDSTFFLPKLVSIIYNLLHDFINRDPLEVVCKVPLYYYFVLCGRIRRKHQEFNLVVLANFMTNDRESQKTWELEDNLRTFHRHFRKNKKVIQFNQVEYKCKISVLLVEFF